MPKVTGPLFSLSASGRVGGGITYQKHNIGWNVRMREFLKGKKTAAQLVVRLWWKKGYYAWRGNVSGYGYYISAYCDGLSQANRNMWHRQGIGQSLGKINYFLKLWMKRSIRGLAQYQIPPDIGFCMADEWLADNLICSGKFIMEEV